MIAQDLFELLHAQPFKQFRLVGTDGKVREVCHPDEAIVPRTRVILPVAAAEGVPEAIEHLALAHIVGFEESAAGV